MFDAQLHDTLTPHNVDTGKDDNYHYTCCYLADLVETLSIAAHTLVVCGRPYDIHSRGRVRGFRAALKTKRIFTFVFPFTPFDFNCNRSLSHLSG